MVESFLQITENTTNYRHMNREHTKIMKFTVYNSKHI
jgi:hypothetical protein